MPLDRVPGDDELYIGSVLALQSPTLLNQHHITHILTVYRRWPGDDDDMSCGGYGGGGSRGSGSSNLKRALAGRARMFIDVDDVEEEDLLVQFPRCVRFIEGALREGRREETKKTTAVYVHCAMGKSRSASVVLAYLLWKYPSRWEGEEEEERGGEGEAGVADASDADADAASGGGEISSKRTKKQSRNGIRNSGIVAVQRALAYLRQARPLVEPNAGFMKQLAVWWTLGCPADTDDAVERHPAYQRWLYHKDVEESARLGRAPERRLFRDEEGGGEDATKEDEKDAGGDMDVTAKPYQLRCKKCRCVLTTSRFVVPHKAPPDLWQQRQQRQQQQQQQCPHYFVEALSWMRPLLEESALEGRLACPNNKCKALLGRYAWQGFQCSCRQWVCPAFSLQRSKVDQVQVVAPRVSSSGGDEGGGGTADATATGATGDATSDAAVRMQRLGIRLPPRAPTGNL